MILVIDNYDSFTYNLVQYLGELGCEIVVHRNDQISLSQIEKLKPDHILISPGPGDPDDAGISLALLKHFHQHIPILGVCLGHQAIGQAFGGKVIRANSLMHGKTSLIQHNKQGIFANVPSPFTATRYHSLVVDETLPTCLTVTARTPSGEMMGLSHNTYPTVGVQFHPESILTEHGHLMLKNFLEMNTMTITPNTESKPNTSPSPAMPAPSASPSSTPPQTKENPITTFTINQALNKILNRKHLYEEEAEAVMTQIMTGGCTEAQIGAYLTALRMKGETVTEIVGSARAMRNAAITVSPTTTDLIDTCGTGGDGTGSFNISTTTAFVVAGAGQPVAKHGNRSVSSKAGSADVLEALGVNLNLTPAQVATSIDQVGLGFMFAPKLHPAMKYAIGPRRQLGVRTIFNILGPLTNPAGADAQIMGVYDADLTEVIARVLGGLGSKAAYVVHGHGGLDELTTSGPNHISLLQNGKVTSTTLDPKSLGFRRSTVEDLKGGDADQNATITRNILSGEDKSPRRDVILLNSAAALVIGGKAKTLADGIALATESIDTGSALSVLEKLIDFTQQLVDY